MQSAQTEVSVRMLLSLHWLLLLPMMVDELILDEFSFEALGGDALRVLHPRDNNIRVRRDCDWLSRCDSA